MPLLPPPWRASRTAALAFEELAVAAWTTHRDGWPALQTRQPIDSRSTPDTHQRPAAHSCSYLYIAQVLMNCECACVFFEKSDTRRPKKVLFCHIHADATRTT